jgi:hypothetical protein
VLDVLLWRGEGVWCEAGLVEARGTRWRR